MDLLFPAMASIVVCGVIVLLLAADKHLEEAGLSWILSESRQTDGVDSPDSQEFFFCLRQHPKMDINASVVCTSTWLDAVISCSWRHWELTGCEFRCFQKE